jgi:3-hydroxybutyryl-CoA dehydrogenase
MASAWGEKLKKDFTNMINPANTLVIIESTHPLYLEIKTHFDTKTPEDALASFNTYDLIFDLSALRTKQKVLLLKEISKTSKAPIITDLTLSWGEVVLKSSPQVSGALSTLFYSPTDAVEFAAKDKTSADTILEFLCIIGKKGIEHKDLKIGFHYPRVISMIVNEAYFALEENLASATDIDLAMKNGVSYPIGPLEWGQKIGVKYIVDLLSEYLEITGEARYRISKELKLAAKYP